SDLPLPEGKRLPRSLLNPQGLRNLTGRTEMVSCQAEARPCPTSLPVGETVPISQAPTRTRKITTSAHHAGFPQGFINSSARLAIDRIVKEPATPTPPARATLPRRRVTRADNRRLHAPTEIVLGRSTTECFGRSRVPRSHGRQGE